VSQNTPGDNIVDHKNLVDYFEATAVLAETILQTALSRAGLEHYFRAE
jgi:hypothetical protein